MTGTPVRVTVDMPQYVDLGDGLDYLSPTDLAQGQWVRVPLGRRQVLGMVWGAPDLPFEAIPTAAGMLSPVALGEQSPRLSGEEFLPEAAHPALKPVEEILDALPPMTERWCALVSFAARYYQRSMGEVALSVVPPELRKLDNAGLLKRVKRLRRQWGLEAPPRAQRKPPHSEPELSPAIAASGSDGAMTPADLPVLAPEQQNAVDRVSEQLNATVSACFLLHGVTGSGKTEVYLRAAQAALDAGRQVLVLVPEINLTPQLEARFAQRFPGRRLVSLHSGLTPAQRLLNWMGAHMGLADLLLGTRMAIFCPLPRLGLIVVDEEHDPSYKQQDGARYSARDLAVYRGHLEKVPVVLGSATPSLESWQQARTGKYHLLEMPHRVGMGKLPEVRMVDMSQQPRPPRGREPPPLSPPLIEAVRERIARGEQSLLFLNRRGFAPVLHCTACGWKSGCPHCSAWRVFHKLDRTLRCHHCGFTERVPMACPECGNPDIEPMGRGTERLEEQMAELLPEARVARIDADTTRLKGSLEEQLAAVHAGEVDVLVGTQMITKGHDFRRVTLVAAVNPDSALYAADFRAPERLFATLMQAAGRAGRDAAAAERSEMWIQTWTPGHAIFGALRTHDFAAFAASQLAEREMAGLPPYSHLALLRAESRDAAAAESFLRSAREQAMQWLHENGDLPVMLYSPVPPQIAKVANLERRQMLIEASHRGALQRLLAHWVPGLHALRSGQRGLARWAIDVDPLGI